jgi:type IV secretory pathway VirD2 relaxase
MFGAANDRADAMAFARRGLNDRRHFRFVITPEDATGMTDFRAFTRDLAVQMESDLGTGLDRVGIAHWNAVNPHLHLVVRGVADDGSISPSRAITSVTASGPRTWFRPSSAPGPSMKSAPLSSAR